MIYDYELIFKQLFLSCILFQSFLPNVVRFSGFSRKQKVSSQNYQHMLPAYCASNQFGYSAYAHWLFFKQLSKIILSVQLLAGGSFTSQKTPPKINKIPTEQKNKTNSQWNLVRNIEIFTSAQEPIFKQFSTMIFIIQLLFSPSISQTRMFSTHNNISKHSFDAMTEDSEIKAPRPRPLESEQLPPDFKLEEQDLCEEVRIKLTLEERERLGFMRRGSMDMHYSILGFIDRKIQEKSRQRIMSEEISHYEM